MSPTDAHIGRKFRTTLDPFQPQKQKQRQHTFQNKTNTISVGTPVFARNYRSGQPNWTPRNQKKTDSLYQWKLVNNSQNTQKPTTAQIHSEQHGWQYSTHSIWHTNGHIYLLRHLPSVLAIVRYLQVGEVLGTRPDEKYQSYSSWGRERELPPGDSALWYLLVP